MGVGPWTAEKHDYLRRYIIATKAARARFLLPVGRGGAAFIDLFAGPGRAQVHGKKEIMDGSPLIAARHHESPFTHLLLCEKDATSAAALRQRLTGDSRAVVYEGDCNAEIDRITEAIPQHGLNLALIDPFGVTPLHFETLAKLGRFDRMDMLLHFPTGDLARNLSQSEDRISRFLGTSTWKKRVSGPKDVLNLLEVLRDHLLPYGYQRAEVRYEPLLKNTKNAPLYHLVLIAKHGLAERIWRSVIRIEGSGQKRMF